jgi:hypothetical protein
LYTISKDEALKFLATVLCLKHDIRTPFYDAEICIDTSESEPRLTGFNFEFFERQPPEGVVMEQKTDIVSGELAEHDQFTGYLGISAGKLARDDSRFDATPQTDYLR